MVVTVVVPGSRVASGRSFAGPGAVTGVTTGASGTGGKLTACSLAFRRAFSSASRLLCSLRSAFSPFPVEVLDVAALRPSQPRMDEWSTTRGRADSLSLVAVVIPTASKRYSGPRAASESRAESGWHVLRNVILGNETQAATAYLGDETTLPRGLR